MQEALVVRRETHIPAPPSAVFVLLKVVLVERQEMMVLLRELNRLIDECK